MLDSNDDDNGDGLSSAKRGLTSFHNVITPELTKNINHEYNFRILF